jgi:hypothetical protein
MYLGPDYTYDYGVWVRYNGISFTSTDIGDVGTYTGCSIAIASDNDIFFFGELSTGYLSYVRINNTGTQSWFVGTTKTIQMTPETVFTTVVISDESPQWIYVLKIEWNNEEVNYLNLLYANVVNEVWNSLSVETANVASRNAMIWGDDSKLHMFYASNATKANFDIIYRNYSRSAGLSSKVNITNNALGNRMPVTVPLQMKKYIPLVWQNGTSTYSIFYTAVNVKEYWSNVTKTLNSNIGTKIAWCVYANDTSDNWNRTSCDSPFTSTAT